MIKFKNNAAGTLSAGIASGATSIVLNAGQGASFPTLGAGDWFYATLITVAGALEIIKVTARSTDTLTVTRGQDGTTAIAFATGDRVELRVTAAALVDLQFPSGTKMLFQQTAAPTGWTKDTTHDNKALRVVTGTAGSGGTVAFTTAFASQTPAGTVGNTTLTTAQMPSHTHNVPTWGTPGKTYSTFQVVGSGAAPGALATNAEGGGGSHTHSFTGTAIDLAVQYVDLIIATKD